MKNLMTISVVIPCYNSEQTIEACLNSVLAQTERVNEIIVVDDGSSDESISIVKKIFQRATKDIELHLHEQKNSGPSIARNKGMEISKSNFIAFLDSDDKWFSDHIKVSKSFLENNEDYKIVATKYLNAPINFTGEIFFNKLLLKNYFLTPCVVLNKKVALGFGGFNDKMKFAEDYDLWLNIIFKRKGYLLDYIGSGNIENKKSFGEKGLSSNLLDMHNGVLKCYKNLYDKKKINFIIYIALKNVESIKFTRRKILTFFNK